MKDRDKDKETKREKNSEKEKEKEKVVDLPTVAQVEAELEKELSKKEYNRVVRTILFALMVTAAVAVIIAVLMFPVLRMSGTSMTNTLMEGDIVVTMNSSDFTTGDVIAFHYNNNLLVKRVIAVTGDWVDIDKDGNVFVNGEQLDEPYVTDKALGECNITLPYQVPEERIFVMGDHRATSIDSRNTAVGCVSKDLVVGKLLIRVWPLSDFGPIQ